MKRKNETGKTAASATIIGLGGIGSWLVQSIAPMMAFDERHDWTLTLVDGDKYSTSNLSRQAFDPKEVGENKANSQARWVLRRFPNVSVRPISEYLPPQNDARGVDLSLFEKAIILLAVDNHKTRKLISDLCSTLKDVTLISGGNEMTDGNVQVYIRKAGIDLTPPLGRYHPEIESPKDKAPFELSCEEAARSDPQILATNLMVASVMLNCFWALTMFEDPVKKNWDILPEVYLDIIENAVRGRKRKV